MNQHPRPAAASLLSIALTVLAAALALHWAARLVLQVWPILLAGFVVVVVTSSLFGYWRSRDRW